MFLLLRYRKSRYNWVISYSIQLYYSGRSLVFHCFQFLDFASENFIVFTKYCKLLAVFFKMLALNILFSSNIVVRFNHGWWSGEVVEYEIHTTKVYPFGKICIASFHLLLSWFLCCLKKFNNYCFQDMNIQFSQFSQIGSKFKFLSFFKLIFLFRLIFLSITVRVIR